MNEELIINEIDENREEYINFLRELVQTDSYNPPGNEKNVALKIEKYLKEADIDCEVFSFGENRANLIAFLNNNNEGKILLYNGHMDVVPVGSGDEWKNPPLSAYIKRKKIMYGRGTADMKSALAGMTIALKILKKLGIEISGNLILNSVADEETGGELGTGWCLENILKKRNIKCDFAVVGEPTGLSPLPKAIILGEKGRMELKIVTNGISGHAAVPFLGKNAIYMMSEIIQNFDQIDNNIPIINPPMPKEKIKDLISEAFPNKEIFMKIFNEQPLLENLVKSLSLFTKSLTMIKGGIKSNVIPDYCEAYADLRLLPGQNAQDIIDSLKKIITDLGYKIKDEPLGAPDEVYVYLEVISLSEASYWEEWENSEDLKDFHGLIKDIYGKTPFYFLFPASADASFYRNSGYCPATVLFGPGGASTAHAINEYVEINDYIQAIKVYTLFAYKFLTKS